MTEQRTENDIVTKIVVVLGILLVGGIFLYERMAYKPDAVNTNPLPIEVSGIKTVSIKGDVQYRPVAGQWSPLNKDTLLHVGDTVATQSEAQAVLAFSSGGYVRLSPDTQIIITSNADGDVSISQTSGRSYHRVRLPANAKYKVESLGQVVTTVGTAFDVASAPDKKEVIIRMIEKSAVVSVSVADKPMQEKNLDAGAHLRIDGIKGISEFKVLSKTDLADAWLVYNRDEDIKLGFNVGILTPAPVKLPTPIRKK